MLSIVYTIIIIIALLFFGVLVWYVATRNSIKRAEQAVNEAEAALDAAEFNYTKTVTPLDGDELIETAYEVDVTED